MVLLGPVNAGGHALKEVFQKRIAVVEKGMCISLKDFEVEFYSRTCLFCLRLVFCIVCIMVWTLTLLWKSGKVKPPFRVSKFSSVGTCH